MYQHFAVVTLVITAAVAMFADGEQREAVAATAVDKPDAIDLAAQGRQANTIKVSRQATQGSFGDELPTGGYGFADDGANSGTSSIVGGSDGIGAIATIPANLTPPAGMSRTAWEALQRRRAKTQASEQATPQQISDLVAQSAARSGAPDTAEGE